jgi:NAD(P)-dependent dehydrogenase (short-subunit alcohol dehydrogenase family)
LRNIVITGSASGIGLATKEKLEAEGDRVIGIDIRDAEIIADLSTPAGRKDAMDKALELTGGEIDGLILSAGLSGMNTPGDMTISVNYFGPVASEMSMCAQKFSVIGNRGKFLSS